MRLDPRKIDITKVSDLEQLLYEVEEASNKNRKAEAWKLYEASEDNQRQYVTQKLAAIYPETFKYFRVGDINITGKVLGKKAKAYKNEPNRSLKNDAETAVYNDILEESKADRALKEFDRIYNGHKYAAIWANYLNPEDDSDELRGKYHLQALAPYEYDLLRHPMTGEPLIFILHYPDTTITGGQDGIEQGITESQKDTAAETKKYVLWSASKKVKVKRTMNIKGEPTEAKVEIIETINNDIERLPVAFLSSSQAVDYPLPSQLANKSIDWNVGLSDLKTAASSQGHGQLVIKKPSGQALDNPHLGKHTAIILPQSSKEKDGATEADYINASPDLLGQLEVLKFDLMNILDDEGIKAKSALSGQGVEQFSSGFDRLLSEADTQDIIEDNQSLYAGVEQEVYEIIKAYEDSMNRRNLSSGKIQVVFEKPKVLISDAETLANIQKREELGLLKSYEKHLIINPNLDEKQAIQREAEIMDEKRERMEALTSLVENDLEEDPNNQNNKDINN